MKIAEHSTAGRLAAAATALVVAGTVGGGSPAWADSAHAPRAGASEATGAADGSGAPFGWRHGRQAAEIEGTQVDGFFGSTVETSADGSIAVVGAYYQDGGTGAAYVYEKHHGGWKQAAELTASDGAAADYFGSNIAVSKDGSTIAVGAWGRDDVTGAAYVFTRKHGTWQQTAELTAPDGVPNDGFGTGMAITPAATTLVVGANGKNDYAGAGYVFRLRHGHWKQAAEVTASDPTEDAGLGGSAAVSADGATVLLGAYLAGDSFDGAAYVFTKSGHTWTQSAELTASDAQPIGYFGMSVGLSSDGTTAVVGSDGHDANTGTVYVFGQQGGAWSQDAEFQGSDTASGDEFGSSVGISGKGNTVVAGALSHDDGRGAVYVFKPSGGTWTQQAELTASDAQVGDYLGSASAISSDGSTIVAGAWGRDSGTGAAYVFER